MTFGLGNRCSIRLSYGTVFDFNALEGEGSRLGDLFPQIPPSGLGLASFYSSPKPCVHPERRVSLQTP